MNWLGFDERKPELEKKRMPPRQESLSEAVEDMMGRRPSVTLADVVAHPVDKIGEFLPRKETDIDRLYRLSNLMHGCAGKYD